MASNRSIGVRELKAHASAVLREVQATGAEVIITVHGRPVVRIEPITNEDSPVLTDGMGGLRDAFPENAGLTWEDFQEVKKFWEPKPLDE